MRKQMILLAIAAIAVIAKAQTVPTEVPYHAMLKEGKMWQVKYHDVIELEDGVEFPVYEVNFVLHGDTLINGQAYFKMYRNSERGTQLEGCFREEGRKVYRHVEALDSPVLWMDFSVAAGDKEDCYWQGGEFVCNLVDTISVNGHFFRRFSFSGTHAFSGMTWVEGVGGEWSPVEPFGHQLNDGKKYELIACYEDGECIFRSDDFKAKSYSDNNIAGLSESRVVMPEKVSALFDLQGRRLTSQPRRGLYIQDGKKMVAK